MTTDNNNTKQQTGVKAGKKRESRILTVLSIEELSNNLKRIVFDDGNKTLTSEHESGYLKLQFKKDDMSNEMVQRSYTILEVQDSKVTIDFVLHESGFGATWAKNAKIGDVVTAIGPGPAKLADFSFDWFILIGDLTALPAITVNLKRLPKDAKGYAIIEVLDESDIFDISKPEGVTIDWIINQNLENSKSLLLSQINEKQWLEGRPYIWLATEFDSARALRQYFKKDKQIEKNQFYYSSYWKRGETDEGNKRAKKMDGNF